MSRFNGVATGRTHIGLAGGKNEDRFLMRAVTGDICGPPWQVAKAVGEGCVAGLNAADCAKKTMA